MKKEGKFLPEANSIQLSKRTNGPMQKDASAGSFSKVFESLQRSPVPGSED